MQNTSSARGRSLPLIFLVLLGACMLALPAAINRGPIYFFDTVGYVRNGSVALEKALGIPAAAPVSEERDASNPAPATGEDANVKWANRSIYYGAVLALGDLIQSMSIVVVAQAAAAAWLLFLIWRVMGPAGPRPWGYAGFCAALAILTPLGLFVAYLIPDLLYALAIPAVALLMLCRDRLSRRETLGVLGVVLISCLSHGAAIMLTAGMLALALIAVPLVARWRMPWRTAGGIVVAMLLAVGSNWAVSKATERAFGQPAIWPPFVLARVLADGPGTLYLQEVCPRDPDRFTLCRYLNELPPVDADHFLWEMDSGFGVFVRATNREQRAIVREQWDLIIPAVLARPGMQIRATLHNTLRQLGLVGVEEFVWRERIRRGFAARFPTQLDELNRTRLPGTGEAWLVVANWVMGTVLALSLLLIAARLLRPGAIRADGSAESREARRETAWLLLLLGGVVVNAVISGALSEPHARYGARVIWLLPMAAALLAAAHRPWLAWRREDHAPHRLREVGAGE